jgi:DNA polymerase III subunit epsilon
VPTIGRAEGTGGAVMMGISIREKLHALLESRPEGVATSELMGAIFAGHGSDPDLNDRIVHQLLGGDPAFVYDPEHRRWANREAAALRVPTHGAAYVVVDLETTGGAPGGGQIIEIGACRMAGPRIEQTFQTLVRPWNRIPRFISAMTSITNEMVHDAPSIEEVLPQFRRFLGDAVLVAHNAQFDSTFLDFEFRRIFGIGLRNPVLCTLRLARRLLPSMRRRGLDAMAEHFGLSTLGRHRGWGDARMAAELLSIFIDMAAQMGVGRLDRLLELQHAGSSGRRIERHVPPETIAALPAEPGVYLMYNERGGLLYVGKARSLKRRVASYFNGGAGLRPRVIELISHVWSIETRLTLNSLEAALLEAKLIRELKPPYNRMLKTSPAAYFVRIDMNDPFPKLTLSTALSRRRGLIQLGPFVGRRSPRRALDALIRLTRLRVCKGRLTPDRSFSPCIYGQMGRCSSPCNLSVDQDAYDLQVRAALEFTRGRTGSLLNRLAAARDQASRAMRFEEARRYQRELQALAAFAARERRLSQAVEENNLIIFEGALAYVILSGRLARRTELDSSAAVQELLEFVADNYERYRGQPIAREDLEPMLIVSRWLRERRADEGRMLFLDGPFVPREAVLAHCGKLLRTLSDGPRMRQAAATSQADPVIQQRWME